MIKKEQIAAPAPESKVVMASPKAKRKKNIGIIIPGKRGFQSRLAIPFKNINPDGSFNPDYRRTYNLCRKHKCTYSELIEKGIIKPDAPIKKDRVQTPVSAQTNSSNDNKHTSLDRPVRHRAWPESTGSLDQIPGACFPESAKLQLDAGN